MLGFAGLEAGWEPPDDHISSWEACCFCVGGWMFWEGWFRSLPSLRAQPRQSHGLAGATLPTGSEARSWAGPRAAQTPACRVW